MHKFDQLPDDIKHRPELLHMRLDNHETRLLHLEHGQSHMPQMSDLMSRQVKTPLGELPLPLAIIAGGLLSYHYPEQVLRLFGQ